MACLLNWPLNERSPAGILSWKRSRFRSTIPGSDTAPFRKAPCYQMMQPGLLLMNIADHLAEGFNFFRKGINAAGKGVYPVGGVIRKPPTKRRRTALMFRLPILLTIYGAISADRPPATLTPAARSASASRCRTAGSHFQDRSRRLRLNSADSGELMSMNSPDQYEPPHRPYLSIVPEATAPSGTLPPWPLDITLRDIPARCCRNFGNAEVTGGKTNRRIKADVPPRHPVAA